MAYLVVRPDRRPREVPGDRGPSRYEIRESVMTAAGPRARTLATFRVLTAGVIADAAARAQRTFDADKIRARASALRVPQRSHEAAATASELLARLHNGESLPPALIAELRRALPRGPVEVPDSLQSAIEWLGADDSTKGRALRDLVDVASRIPARARSRASAFPRLSSKGMQ
ncbi:MAG: hypothetical protein JWM72_3217 [Actinomycetia bacterium]|nr:hypothetical protein [Actinomycetes bacterium]